ncbi:cytochrome bc complex cytochrome b subunit [Robbsia sp. Bb-Pol-6]|uniref:Cytochrome b n=1 Tax=Robbsia betulipollinis TaxID=2981849 RepID=A0ABT3ZQ10_9BURK|nr:cytochrome bc complex cytochrome b subunit [Robbsia betulipollinis]MCY0388367.1 cytochrome bc complex cytochrome b subunit [Robbsia betulipollinis]
MPSRLLHWIDARFPLSALWRRHFTGYRVPRNLNVWYVFGSLAMLVLVIQFVSGLFLTMHYKPDAALAFDSVERIMRDVPWGWLIRYVHSTGASLFFVVLYLHLFRGLIYGSYRKPRELVWLVGCLSLLCMMAEAFFGYLLPWGQMSYWGAQVIVNLFSAIPGIGPGLATWIRGDFVVSDVTLNRFFAFHVIAVPLLLALVVALHLSTLRQVGSSNPDGIDIVPAAPGEPGGEAPDVTAQGVTAQGVTAQGVTAQGDADTLPFHPYFVLKDLLAAALFLTLFAAIVFFAPTMGGTFLEANNFVPADTLHTPADIAPVWYFTPFYAMLRATTEDFKIVLMIAAGAWGLLGVRRRADGGNRAGAPAGAGAAARAKRPWMRPAVALVLILAMSVTEARLWGVILMAGAVLVLFFLPWLDRGPVRSIRYRPRGQIAAYGALVVAFVALGVIGTRPPDALATLLAQACTLVYFGFFLGMPWWSPRGRFRAEPARITRSRAERRRLARGGP